MYFIDKIVYFNEDYNYENIHASFRQMRITFTSAIVKHKKVQT